MRVINNNRLLLDLRHGIGYALTRLSLFQSEDVEHLVLRQSTPLFTAKLRVGTQDLEPMFDAIGNLSHLKTICISDFGVAHEEGETTMECLQIECLVRLVTKSSRHGHLRSLRLDSIRMAGSPRDFQALADALENHPTLQEIVVSGCVPAHVYHDNNNNSSNDSNHHHSDGSIMQPLAVAMARMQTLKTVEIVETSFPPSGAWTGDSLSQLLQSKTLQTLRIRGVRFLGDKDVALMARALEHNHALKELWILSCELGFTGHGATAMAQMLRVNNTLDILGLNRLSSNSHAIAIAQALHDNTSLRGLHLCLRDGLNSRTFESFAELMEQNYVLETMSGGFMNSNKAGLSNCALHRKTLDFYLRLNQNGRRRLLQNSNATRQQWLETLSSQSDDVSALFYLLSRNPLLCLCE